MSLLHSFPNDTFVKVVGEERINTFQSKIEIVKEQIVERILCTI